MWGIVSSGARDPNWLLATVATSAAALVAIIGGLLVARLAELASKRDRARREAEEADNLVERTAKEVARIDAVLIGYEKDDWITKALPEMVRTPDASIPFLSRKAGTWDHGDTLLEGDLDTVRRLIAQAAGEIAAAAGKEPLPRSWDEFREDHGLHCPSGLPHMVYEQVFLARSEQQNERRVSDAATAADAELGAGETRSTSSMAAQLLRLGRRSAPSPRWQIKLAPSGERMRLAADLGQARAAYEQAVVAAQSARIRSASGAVPSNTWGAVWALVYLAVVGVGLPCVLLAFEPTDLAVGWRVAVVGSFVLGLAGLAVVFIHGFTVKEEELT